MGTELAVLYVIGLALRPITLDKQSYKGLPEANIRPACSCLVSFLASVSSFLQDTKKIPKNTIKMTIGHTGIKTPAADHATVVAWYEAALAPLGYARSMAFLDNQVVGFGDSPHGTDWWVTSAAAAPPGVPPPASASAASILPTHTAFVAKGEFSFLFFPFFCCLSAAMCVCVTCWGADGAGRPRHRRCLPQGWRRCGRKVQRRAGHQGPVRAHVLRGVCAGPRW